MFAIRVEAEFRATHAVTIAGVPETPHAHDWRVLVTLEGPALDADGLLWDFHALEADLGEVVQPLRGTDLNRTPPFDRVNPAAEAVAEHIGVCLAARLTTRLARYPKSEWSMGLRIAAVEVTEAPGCVAIYRPAAAQVSHG